MKNSIQSRLDALGKKLVIDPQKDPTVYYIKYLSEAMCLHETRQKYPERFEGKRIVYEPLVEKELKRIFSLPRKPLDPRLVAQYKQLKKEYPDSSAWELLDPDGEFDEK